MNKMCKVMAISVITALVLTLPLAAQSFQGSPDGDVTSNQRMATGSIYKTDVDNYLHVNNWLGVNDGLNKWFAFVHGKDGSAMFAANPDDAAGAAGFRGNLGFATKVSGIYIGARYYGNILQDTGGTDSVTKTPTYNQVGQYLESVEETTVYANKWLNSTNQLEVLIGVAGHGIKVGFFESMAVYGSEGPTAAYNAGAWTGRPFIKTTNYDTGIIEYSGQTVDYSYLGGHLRPSLQWGSQFNVADLTLKPRFLAAIDIFQNQWIDEWKGNPSAGPNPTYTYFTLNDNPIAPVTTNRQGFDNGYLQPTFSVGADIGLPKKGAMGVTATIDYTIDFRVYDNDYGSSGFSGSAAGPVTWGGATAGAPATVLTTTTQNGFGDIIEETTTKAATLGFHDTTYSNHVIQPKVTFDSAVADRLKVGFSIIAPITITVQAVDAYTEAKTFTQTIRNFPVNLADSSTTTNGTVHTPQGLTETTTFNIKPNVNFGASYDLFPGRFTVNAGIRAYFCDFTQTTTKVSPNGFGARTTSETVDGEGVVTGKTDSTAYAVQADSATTTTTMNAFSAVVAGGFVFHFTEQVALDLLAAVNATAGSSFNIDAAMVNVMLTLKF